MIENLKLNFNIYITHIGLFLCVLYKLQLISSISYPRTVIEKKNWKYINNKLFKQKWPSRIYKWAFSLSHKTQ